MKSFGFGNSFGQSFGFGIGFGIGFGRNSKLRFLSFTKTYICGYERHLRVIFVLKKSKFIKEFRKPDLRENPI